jgi:general secretion pathway protein C
MDVAKLVAKWKEQPPEQWLGTANRYLPPGVTAVLVLAIAYQLATLTWALVPGATIGTAAVVPAAPAKGPASGNDSLGNYGALSSTHLFGEAPKQSTTPAPQEEVVDAPDTTLSLMLTGILAGDGGSSGQAIISSNNGEQRTYQVGQSIDNANGTTLNSVHADRVLLNRGDRLETLRLQDPAGTPGSPATAATGRTFMAPVAAPPQNDSLRQVISQNATKLTDIIRLAPALDGGQVVGFRVNPGRDKETFEALGLKAGDVVTDINGTVLDDPGRGIQVLEALGEATMANVTVLRDGSPQVIVIDTSQLQNLREGRE